MPKPDSGCRGTMISASSRCGELAVETPGLVSVISIVMGMFSWAVLLGVATVPRSQRHLPLKGGEPALGPRSEGRPAKRVGWGSRDKY
jgi:hypothetical protein